MINDKMKINGHLVATLRGPDGLIKDRWEEDNLVVTTGKQHVTAVLQESGDSIANPMSHMAIGSGSTTQVIGDTALETEISRKTTVKTIVGGVQVQYVTAWASGEGTGSISEAGIFNASTSGTMMSRTTFATKEKGSGDSLTLTWTITIN